VELKEILLIKFGRKLQARTITHFLGINDTILDTIDQLRQNQEEINRFKKKYGLRDETKNICIGYSATPKHNHLKVLKCFDGKNYQDYLFILPLTYGGNEEYIEQIKRYAEKSSLKIIIIENFLSLKELALLRLCCGYFLQTRESDANSGSFYEAVYAGATAFAGTWLPYGNIRQAGIRFFEYEKYEEIPVKVRHDKLSNKNCSDNQMIIRKRFGQKAQINNWVEIYENISGKN
jgi:hypothetical protein